MFSEFGQKQLQVLAWWADKRTAEQYQTLICDGAVRSGKTCVMALSFVLWAMESFQGENFAICGKTIGAVRRNVVEPLKKAADGLYAVRERRSDTYFELASDGRRNRFYLFGGKDEGSAGLIQGITLAGALLDETALMPRSFVEQTLARCSVEGARFWFNCNPQGSSHWFYREWIQKAEEKRALRLHFTMDDNPSLSEEVKERYRNLYSGAFYRRYVLGEWVAAEGRVYPMFDPLKHMMRELPAALTNAGAVCRYWVSCDYGTLNPFSMGLWGEWEGRWYRMREFYYDGRQKGPLTDEEYYEALLKLAQGFPVQRVIVDPSAASFIECIRRHGRFAVRPARNSVLSGIQHVSQLLKEEKLLFSADCTDTLREFGEYVWDSGGRERPLKENDHAMDDIRYFVETAVFGGGGLSF